MSCSVSKNAGEVVSAFEILHIDIAYDIYCQRGVADRGDTDNKQPLCW